FSVFVRVSFSSFYGYVDHRYLHSFPTRRSSDLIMEGMLQVHGLLREQGLDPEREETWISLLMGMSLSVTMHQRGIDFFLAADHVDRKSTRLNSSHVKISYAVFCLKKKKHIK